MEKMQHRVRVEVILQLERVVRSVDGENDGVGEADRLETKMFCDRDVLHKARVRVQLLPPLRVENRVIMIHGVRECTAEAEVQAGNAETLKEDSEVTTRTKRRDTDIITRSICLDLLVHRKEVGVNVFAEVGAFIGPRIPKCARRIRGVLNRLRRIADKVREGRRTRSVVGATAGRTIEVEVCNNVLLDPVGEILTPFGTTNQTVLNNDEPRTT